MPLLGGHEGFQLFSGPWGLPLLVPIGRQPFAAAAYRQQTSIGVQVPMPGQAGLLEGQVEAMAVTLEFGLGQGAIHIPEQGLQPLAHAVSSPALIRAG